MSDIVRIQAALDFHARYSDTTPVDAAWLESMGAEWRKGTLILKANGHEIYQWSTGKRWSIQDESVSVAVYTLWYDNPTRGQLLHLLAALTTKSDGGCAARDRQRSDSGTQNK